jgi:hypothetical protein
MLRRLTDEQVRLLRVRAQGLTEMASDEPGPARVAAVSRAVCGLQAQEETAMGLGVRARSPGLRLSDVETAQFEQRTAVRTWALRSTLHLVAAEDLGWLIPVLAPAFLPAERRRLRQLGVDEETTQRGLRALERALADGPLTRAELAEHVRAHRVDPAGQRLIHLIHMAALEGTMVYGPHRGGDSTFVLLRDWVPLGPYPGDDAALEELVRRYVAGYGPVALPDLARWSGLALSRLRPAWGRIEAELLPVETSSGRLFLHAGQAASLDDLSPGARSVRLLGRFDDYLLGYADRGFAVPAGVALRVHPGGGIIHRTLLVAGVVAGTWELAQRRGGVRVMVEPFVPLSEQTQEALGAEAADLGRYLGKSAELAFRAPTRP